MARARPTTRVYHLADSLPQYKLETTLGVAVTPDTTMDYVTGGELYIEPNVKERRAVGVLTERYGGVIRAGIENLALELQTAEFIAKCLRTADGTPGGTWGYNTPVPSMSIIGGNAGAAPDSGKIWGACINDFRIYQEYSGDGEVLKAELSILAVGGAAPVTLAEKATAVSGTRMQSWQSLCTFTGIDAPTEGCRVRRWEIRGRNNLEYQTLGDKAATTAIRGAGASNDLREAWGFLQGEEDIEATFDFEVPVDWSTAADYTANGYTPGDFGATLLYTNSISGSPVYLRFVLENMCADPMLGFRFKYEAENQDREPVHVYTCKFVKKDRSAQSLSIYNTSGA